MRILVTGASGWIGSASVSELLSAGHEVLGGAFGGLRCKRSVGDGLEQRAERQRMTGRWFVVRHGGPFDSTESASLELGGARSHRPIL